MFWCYEIKQSGFNPHQRSCSRHQNTEKRRIERLQASTAGLLCHGLLCASPLYVCYHTSGTACDLLNSHLLSVQVRLTCRRTWQPARTCRAIVAPATHTNGAALRAGKPVLENPLRRDSVQSDNPSAAAQLYRQPKGMLPTRLRLFAGTANPVRRPSLCHATS